MKSIHAEREHSKISPSKLKSLEVSPLFEQEDREPHPITLIGTKIHEALDRGTLVDLRDEEVDLYNFCDRRDKQWEAVFKYIRKEIRIDLTRWGIWGFADRVQLDDFHKPTQGVLIDYKFSTQMQESTETNPAAQAYCLGLFEMWPSLLKLTVEYYYPRLGVIDSCVYTRKDMGTITVRIAAIVKRVQTAKTCQINEATCIYCKHLALCPQVTEQAMPIALRYAERKQFVLPTELDPMMVTEPEHMAKLLSYAEVMEEWSGSVKQHAKELRQLNGLEIPGWDLVSRQGKLTVDDVNGAYKLATQKYGVSHDEFLAATKVSISDISEAIKRNAPARAKGKQTESFKSELLDGNMASQGAESWFLTKTKKKG